MRIRTSKLAATALATALAFGAVACEADVEGGGEGEGVVEGEGIVEGEEGEGLVEGED